MKVLGTQIPVIVATEDREIFSDTLKQIDETLALSYPGEDGCPWIQSLPLQLLVSPLGWR